MDKQTFWSRCDPEMQEFIKDCKELRGLLTAFDGKVTEKPSEGIVPFMTMPWEHCGRGDRYDC